MATFKDWALQYVLSDDETVQHEFSEKAAKEIENARANSTVLGNWALSVNQWLTTASAGDDDDGEDGDEAPSGDIIARAKALGFMADTLEVLGRNTLKSEQVRFLVGFFGAIFSYDHKAGITAATKALRQLYSMKGFNASMGVKMLEDVLKIKEDFRLQTGATRLEIYELFLSLLQDQSVSSELQHKYGTSLGFIVDLLQLCQHERDPKNLLVWFKILPTLLRDYSPSPEITEEIFKAFSAYFPISIRSSATPIGITAEDLKEAVRGCFASHQRVAPLAFPFLMQKLDQGDAVTVTVKVDILRTIKACIEQFDHPQNSVVPYIDKIWSSLKYEVRNGEVKETIDATLEVLRAIAKRLDGTKTFKYDAAMLKNYIDMVFKDCRDDLSNPTYTKQAGLLLVTVITANIKGFYLESANLLDCIRQNLRQPKSPSHTRDLVLLLNSILRARQELFEGRANGHPEDVEQLKTGPDPANLESLFHEVYVPIWVGKPKAPGSVNSSEDWSEDRYIPHWVQKPNKPDTVTTDTLKKVAQGLALLVSQRRISQSGGVFRLCSSNTSSDICSLLARCLYNPLTLSSNDQDTTSADLENEVVLALRTIVMNHRETYNTLMSFAKLEIEKRHWTNPSRHSLAALKDLFSRLAFIGCSDFPINITTETSPEVYYSPLQHLITFAAIQLTFFPFYRPNDKNSFKESPAKSYVISALHAALLHFRDACVARYQQADLVKYSGSEQNWIDEYKSLPEDWLQQLRSDPSKTDATVWSLKEDDPEVYRQFLKVGLFFVRSLYIDASKSSGTWNEAALFQLSKIAALVVRALDEKLQTTCLLAKEAFNFFRPSTEPVQEGMPTPFGGLLTLGILEGLWPQAMTELYQPDGLADSYMLDVRRTKDITPASTEIRAAIGAILANKYKGPPSISPCFLKELVNTATTSIEHVDPKTFEANIKIAMNILAGAAARQDKYIVEAVPLLRAAISSPSPNSEIAAQSLGIIVQDNEFLTAENHAVVKRFFKQWAYNYVAKPLFELALPKPQSDPATGAKYTTAILSLVRNCPFTVYQDDLEPLIRLLITSLAKGSPGLTNQEIARKRTVSALEILVEVLTNEPDSVKGHLKPIITNGMNLYNDISREHDLQLVMSRKLVLQLLGAIPTKFEERHLLPYAPQMKRMLATACGDSVREIRKTAIIARENWSKIGA
ncbi:MMS19 nucleotide excision repair protein [Rhypophila decipiens]|uniref:MMS19 nucleotide excision repair protein n=1 Tax=Rhypophila decipiens TaxID=261697 RepID=A0AAN7BAK8_9PEZI|nr:MMS19 nucleotide excision repair protein [Rhypophila decipiens]